MFRLLATTILASCLTVLGGCAAKATVEKTVPPGTALEVELLDGLSSASNSQGDAVSARVAQDVAVGGKVVIPAGSTVTGTITEARGLKAIGGRALASEMTSIRIDDPVMFDAQLEITLRLGHEVVLPVRRRQDFDDERGWPLDPTCRKLRWVGHHQDVRFCHVVRSKNHVERREEDLGKFVSFEKLIEFAKQTLRHVLVR